MFIELESGIVINTKHIVSIVPSGRPISLPDGREVAYNLHMLDKDVIGLTANDFRRLAQIMFKKEHTNEE